MKLLLIEDVEPLASLMQSALESAGFRVDTAVSVEQADALITSAPPDVIVLDLGLPDGDGLDFLRQLRSGGTGIPVLVVTARGGLNDRIDGLDGGADDYMVKPLRALFRRHRMEVAPEVYRYADLELTPRTRQVRRGGDGVELTAKEFDLLELFMRHPGQVLTREVIYEHIWEYDFGGESNIIEVYVRYLRSKLEAGGKSRLLQTVRGVGYALREN